MHSRSYKAYMGRVNPSYRASSQDETDGTVSISYTALLRLASKANATSNTLNLSSYNIDDNVLLRLIDYLPTYSNIIHLQLSNNKVSDVGIFRLCSILKSTSITSLDLRNSNITTIGIKYLIKAINNNPSLIKIIICQNDIEATVLEEFTQSIANNNLIQNQIKADIEKTSIYSIIVESLLTTLSADITYIILNYYSESNLMEAKSHLQKNLLPKIISWYYPEYSKRSKNKIFETNLKTGLVAVDSQKAPKFAYHLMESSLDFL